jgi:competence protein CoiA
MPLRCIGSDGNAIQSFDLTNVEWSSLRHDNRLSRQLRMPCCDASVVMKTSTRGLNFFAHKARGLCQSAPETEEHRVLKALAAEAARRAGWTCSTEASGSSPSGEVWIADVLAQKGQAKVAIEIQRSGQTVQESLFRHERYRQSGVRCLWLFRRPKFPNSENFPAVCVSGDIVGGFEAHGIPLAEFLDAAFAKRFRYGIPLEAKAIVRIHSGMLNCWKANCRARTSIVRLIEVLVGPHRCQFGVPDLNDFPDLLASCQEHIPQGSGVGLIKPRYSRTQERSYMSNGCYRCDALVGQFLEHYAWEDEGVILAEFPISISARWKQAIESNEQGDSGWAVFTFA